MKSTLNIHCKDWCWSWSSNILAIMRRTDTLEKTLMLEKIESRRWRGQHRLRWLDGIISSMVDGITDSMDMSLSNSRRCWRTEKPGVLQFMGSPWVRHDWAIEMNWMMEGFNDLSFWRKGGIFPCVGERPDLIRGKGPVFYCLSF